LSKREKKSASAFETLRELKKGGIRNKWGTEESSAIYNEVDEAEYTKIVSSRASDWIVDNGEFVKVSLLKAGL
jgi:DNA polymerase alpha subunit p180 N terminal